MQHPINWTTDKCCLCKFSLNIEPLGPNLPDNEMSYGDFYIRCEQKFLRNMYFNEQLESSPQISALANYYQTYQKFLKICLAL